MLGLALIIGLIGLALSFSLHSAFSSPTHLETWVKSSNFYSDVINNTTNDVGVSLESSSIDTATLSLIRGDLIQAFPVQQFTADTNKVIDANYLWLEGKSSIPNFNINLSQTKFDLANRLGNYTQSRYLALPKCTLAEIAKLNSTNPLALTCQIPSISPSLVKSEIITLVEQSKVVVKGNIIDAASFKTSGQPYYKQFNGPQIYSRLKIAPVAFALMALITLVFLLLLNYRKKSLFFITLSLCFAISGLVLIVVSSLSSVLNNKLDSLINLHTNISAYKVSLDNLIHLVLSYISSLTIWFSPAYILIAMLLLGIYFRTRSMPAAKPAVATKTVEPAVPGVVKQPENPTSVQAKRPRRLIQ